MTEPLRLEPETTTLHLDYNAGEDSTVEIVVTDREDTPVPIVSAVGVIGLPGCAAPLHEWSAAAGNLSLADQAVSPGVVWITASRDETAAWSRAWGDAEWQLDAIDLFDRAKRVCYGHVRVWASRRGGGEENDT